MAKTAPAPKLDLKTGSGVTVVFLTSIIKQILHEDLTIQEIADNIGANRKTVARHIKAMREAKLVYIHDWGFDNRKRPNTAYYKFTTTPQKDARRPPPKTAKEMNREHNKVARGRKLISVFHIGPKDMNLLA